jgi:hypothetical protein
MKLGRLGGVENARPYSHRHKNTFCIFKKNMRFEMMVAVIVIL